jgi:phenylacetate-coenzyme A ligase PaaK-like adenylate-forming protein
MDSLQLVERRPTMYRHAEPKQVRSLAAEMLAREQWPRSRLLAYQQDRVRAIVRHAVARSPYYREIMGRDVHAGGTDSDFALDRLATMTKQTLMSQWDRIVTDPQLHLADAEEHIAGEHAGEPLLDRYQVFASGGTTGVQGVAVYDLPAWEIAVASLQRAIATQDISPTARVVGIGSPTPLHMSNRLFAALRPAGQPGPMLSVTTPLPEVVATLNALQPEAVLTYPSFIRRLAEEQAAGRLRIAPTKFCSAAETLTPDVREIARDTWGAVVLNLYGATEVCLIGTECPYTSGLHVPEDLIALEVVDEHNRPVASGVVGHKVLVTNLYNRTLPFIRYELSDLVAVASGACPCGRPHLRLASIQGRQEDVLKLPARAGGYVHVHAIHLHALLIRIPTIRQFELASRAGELLVRLALKPSGGMDEALQRAGLALESELHRLGASARITLELVEDIARSGTGAKLKLVRA